MRWWSRGLLARPAWRWATAIARPSGHHWAWTGTLALGLLLALWLALQAWMSGLPGRIQFVTAGNAAAIVALALLPAIREHFVLR